MPTAGPWRAENIGVISIAAPKPAKPRTMPAMQAITAEARKGKLNKSGIAGGTLTLPERQARII